jgi:hypothetical protein
MPELSDLNLNWLSRVSRVTRPGKGCLTLRLLCAVATLAQKHYAATAYAGGVNVSSSHLTSSIRAAEITEQNWVLLC